MAGESMGAFYWRLLKATPGEAQTAKDQVVLWGAVILILLALFSPELAREVPADWDEKWRWVAALPAALVLWRIARNNHQAFQQLETRISTPAEFKAIANELAEFHKQVKRCQKNFDGKRLKELDPQVARYLGTHPRLGPAYEVLYTDGTGVSPQPPPGVSGDRRDVWCRAYTRLFRLNEWIRECLKHSQDFDGRSASSA